MSVFIFGSFFSIILLDIVISVKKKEEKLELFQSNNFN